MTNADTSIYEAPAFAGVGERKLDKAQRAFDLRMRELRRAGSGAGRDSFAKQRRQKQPLGKTLALAGGEQGVRRQHPAGRMSSLPRDANRPPASHLDWKKEAAAFLARYAHVPIEAVIGVQVGRIIYGEAGIADPMTGVQYRELHVAASHKTCELRGHTLFRLMRTLHAAGMKLISPWKIKPQHIRQLLDSFRDRRAADDLASASIAQYMNILSWWTAVVGQDKAFRDAKAQMDPSMWARSLMADHDKTWEGNKIDIGKKIDEAWVMEPFVGMALLAQHAFGLRRLESLMFHPKEDYEDGFLKIFRGTKGGRPRVCQISSPWQGKVLEVLSTYCTKTGSNSIGANGNSLATNLNRYKYVMRAIGITKKESGVVGHGLRAGFACRMLDSLGVKPPVWGGSGRSADDEIDKNAYTQVSSALGHSRRAVVGAYIGTVRSVQARQPSTEQEK